MRMIQRPIFVSILCSYPRTPPVSAPLRMRKIATYFRLSPKRLARREAQWPPLILQNDGTSAGSSPARVYQGNDWCQRETPASNAAYSNRRFARSPIGHPRLLKRERQSQLQLIRR
jgi:hypothetical protein